MNHLEISKKNKVKIGIWAGIYILAVLIFLGIFLEGLGSFVGVLVDKPVAEDYISKNYQGLSYKYVSGKLVNEEQNKLGVKSPYKSYRFTYEVLSNSCDNTGSLKIGDIFSIDAYNFSVTNDSIYMEYNCDTALLKDVNGKLLSDLVDFCDNNENISFTAVDAYIDIKPEIGEFTEVSEAIVSTKAKNADVVLHFVGDKMDFATYKKTIAPIINFYSEENDFVRPKNLQLIYYYINENNERIMEYESQLVDFDVNEVIYTVETISNSSKNIHFKVELDESDSKKLTAYNTVKTIYLIVLGGTITVLYTYFTIKRIRKLLKQGQAL